MRIVPQHESGQLTLLTEIFRLSLGKSSNSSANHEGSAVSTVGFPVLSHLALKSLLFVVNKNVS